MLGAYHYKKSDKKTEKALIDNLVFDTKSGWQAKDAKKQPTITLECHIDSNAYAYVRYQCPVGKKAVLGCV